VGPGLRTLHYSALVSLERDNTILDEIYQIL